MSKITRAKWTEYGSSGRAPALQLQSPELKLKSHKKINNAVLAQACNPATWEAE
jgi:hypothetical protein